MLDLTYNSNFLHNAIKTNTSLRITEKRKFKFGDQVYIFKKDSKSNEGITSGFIAGIVFSSNSLINLYYVYGKGFYRSSDLMFLPCAKHLFSTNPTDAKYINMLDKETKLYDTPNGNTFYPVFPAKNTELSWNKGELAIVSAPNTFYDGILVQLVADVNAHKIAQSLCAQVKIVLPIVDDKEHLAKNYHKGTDYFVFSETLPLCYLCKTTLTKKNILNN